MKRYSTVLAAMSNAKRLEILTALVGSEIPVGKLAAQVGLSQSALSQHLAKLRSAKLVETRRDAQTIFYSSNSVEVKAVLSALRDTIGEP
jgi:DNA-binding transcriptional ArsR family regulator